MGEDQKPDSLCATNTEQCRLFWFNGWYRCYRI